MIITCLSACTESSDSINVSATLTVAQRYLSEMKYEQAVIEFDKILTVDAKNASAYLGKAEAYIAFSDIKSAIEILQKGYELTNDEKIKEKLDELLTTTTTTEETTTQPAETTKNINEIATGEVTNGQVVTKLSDGHWWGISLFGGGNGKTYAKALNRFKKEIGDNVNVWSMIAPTSGEFYLPDSYAQYNTSRTKSIEQINAQLTGVTPVDCVSSLRQHTDENIYLRTDHHSLVHRNNCRYADTCGTASRVENRREKAARMAASMPASAAAVHSA